MDAKRIEALVQKGLAAEADEEAAEKASIDERIRHITWELDELNRYVIGFVNAYFKDGEYNDDAPIAKRYPYLQHLVTVQRSLISASKAADTMYNCSL